MRNMAKNISVILVVVMLLSLTACLENNPFSRSNEIKKVADQVIEALIDENAEDLFGTFCEEIRYIRQDKTMEEIQQLFDFIDGKIVSYEYSEGGGMKSNHYGTIEYYNCNLDFRNVTTDTGRKYTIYCDFQYIWLERPRCEGVNKIRIYENDDHDNALEVGKFFYREDPYDPNDIADENYLQTYAYERKDHIIKSISVTAEARQNLQYITVVDNIMDKDYMCSGVVGLIEAPFSIEIYSEIEEATISFGIDQTKLEGVAFTDLIFLWYDEDNSNFIELEPKYDEENSTVSIRVEQLGKYMLVDMHEWFKAKNYEINYFD